MLRRCTLLMMSLLGLVVAVMPLKAQLRIGTRGVGHRFFGGHRSHSSFRGGFGFASHRSFFAPRFFGSGLYPYHFGFGGISPRFAYGVPLTGRPQYRVWVLGATHDWRYWDPTSGIIEGGIIEGGIVEGPLADSSAPQATGESVPQPFLDSRVIGMGIPQWALGNQEPLGNVARRHRALAARARSARPMLAAHRIERP